MTITEWIKYEKLEKENEALKNELAKKDKEHKEQLKRIYEQFKHDKEFEITQYKFETEQQQLYKEDFRCGVQINESIEFWDEQEHQQSENRKYVLKDNSKYDKLPSKDVK